MGTIGGLVVPLVLAAAIGFVVGWLFARAGRKPDGGPGGPPSTNDVVGGSVDVDQRVARLESDYARRVEVFSKREAELITAGRKVVEQLRQREAELAELGVGSSPDDAVVTARPGGRMSPATSEVPVADDEPEAPLPSPSLSDAPSAVPSAPTRSRRAVIDPATGRPISAPEPEPEPELSVRLIAPALTHNEPRVIDLRERRPAPSAADGVTTNPTVTSSPKPSGGLIDIDGIGPKTIDRLRLAGVASLADLARLDPDGPLPPSIEGLRGRLRRDDWIGQARRLTS